MLLVLDNYHEVPLDSRLHGCLAAAAEEVPEGSNLIVMSRAQPPADYARAQLSETVMGIAWEDLRLTARHGLFVQFSTLKSACRRP